MDEQYIQIGHRIQKRRKALHIKQSELAELLDISNNHMSSIETGKQKPSLDVLLKICEHLNTTPNHLLLGCMYPNDVSKDIIDTICLCSKEQMQLVREFAELLYLRKFTNI